MNKQLLLLLLVLCVSLPVFSQCLHYLDPINPIGGAVSATISPDSATILEEGRWDIRFQNDSFGIDSGSEFKLCLTKSFAAQRGRQ